MSELDKTPLLDETQQAAQMAEDNPQKPMSLSEELQDLQKQLNLNHRVPPLTKDQRLEIEERICELKLLIEQELIEKD